jgi:hypothetical protein
MKTRKTTQKTKKVSTASMKDPLAYIREHHNGIIDFDAGMLLTFGFYNLHEKSPSSLPCREEIPLPKTY